jgi:tripartite-type tricarboxylate transporter receptor subunit TctC
VSVIGDIPTLAESGLPGFRFDSWGAIFAPAKTPRAIIDKLNREITAALRQADIGKQMRAFGVEPAPTTPAELDRFVAAEMATIAKLAKAAGITPQ